jgi:hypothetical protein
MRFLDRRIVRARGERRQQRYDEREAQAPGLAATA